MTTNMLTLIQELGYEIVVTQPDAATEQQTTLTQNDQPAAWWSRR
jgi:hypothetical protein